jgi:Flp pilus assembly protein TadB
VRHNAAGYGAGECQGYAVKSGASRPPERREGMLKAMRWLVLLAQILAVFILWIVAIVIAIIVVPLTYLLQYSALLVDTLREKTYRKYKDLKGEKKC